MIGRDMENNKRACSGQRKSFEKASAARSYSRLMMKASLLL